MTPEQRNQLAAPFQPGDLEWRVMASRFNQKKQVVAHIAPYVTARAVMDRLDSVFADWSDELIYNENHNFFTCKITAGGVTRQDVAEVSKIEPIKGGASDAFKRAAVKFGIGRYLYDLPAFYAICEEKGENRVKHDGQWYRWNSPTPDQLPKWALPKGKEAA